MLKNTAGQNISAQLISKTDGSDVTTGTTTVYVTKDNGTQTAGTGTVTHKGNGEWNYAPVQAETNANYIKFTFVNTAAITAGISVYTISYNPHDTVRLGLTALPNAAANAAGGLIISAGGSLATDTLLGRLDATISSRMATYTQPTGFLTATFPTTLASPTNITAGTITTVTNLTNLPAITNNWLTAAGIAAGALSGKGDWNIGKTGYSITGTITTLDALDTAQDTQHSTTQTLIGSGGANLSAIPWNVNWDAEVQSECVDALIAYDPPTRSELTSDIASLAQYIDTEVAAILAVTNKLDTALELDGAVYRFTVNALELAPSGGGGGGDATLANQTAILAALGVIDANVDAILVDTGTTLPGTLSVIAGYIDTEVASIITMLGNIQGTGFDTNTHSLVLIASAGGSLTATQSAQLAAIYSAVNSKPVIQSDIDENPAGDVVKIIRGDTYGENFNASKVWTVDYGVTLSGATITFTAVYKKTKAVILQKSLTATLVSGTEYTIPLDLTTAQSKLFTKTDDIIFDVRIVSGTDVDHMIIGSVQVVDVINVG